MSEKVIELSIEETNKLRADLGLKPLRVSQPQPTTKASSNENEVLEMSVDETNALREKLGLKPLKMSGGADIVHKPAENEGEKKKKELQEEKERVEKEVQKGVQSAFGETTLADGSKDATLSWVETMRNKNKNKNKNKNNKHKGEQQKEQTDKKDSSKQDDYSAHDLEGLNVTHAASDFQAGSTTILTLSDTALLQTSQNNKVIGLHQDQTSRLQNVEMADQKAQQDGLQRKRHLEMGMGRAGGYAGYDDDEFEELGGTKGPSRLARGGIGGGGGGGITDETDDKQKKQRGFVLGSVISDETENNDQDDLFAFRSGKAISLVPVNADTIASDFMTVDEDEALMRKKKEAKFKKKKKKKDKKKNKRKTKVEEDDHEEEMENTTKTSRGLLDDLEETATVPERRHKRRREEGNDDSDKEDDGKEPAHFNIFTKKKTQVSAIQSALNDETALSKRIKYDAIMQKGNERTTQAFNPIQPEEEDIGDPDEEPDDEFLNEALAKARRLRRLRQLSSKTNGKTPNKAADAVVQALKASENVGNQNNNATAGTVTFAVDDTQEFTRALRARAEQEERQKARKAAKKDEHVSTIKKTEPKVEDLPMEDADGDSQQKDDEEAHTEDMTELAKEIKDDDDIGFEGTANTVGVGRGLSSVLSMLRHTGEITGKNAGREEMRGRAKDERTYEDYKSLDLAKVVRIGRNATEKDRDLASREIKLDYRDEHGRLLTRKEAYRQMCYQFHGHGSSKKNQEKRLRQIEREQAEARLASRQGGGAGYFAALKNTQKATGKAFVVHKTT